MEKIKCPLCKRRKFNDRDIEYLENTGRCSKCDFKIHAQDRFEERQALLNTKDTFTRSDVKALNIRLQGL